MDRSAAYAARWIAKHIVAAGLARRATLQLSYAIEQPDPVSLLVDTHGTGKVPDEALERAVRKTFGLSVDGIVNDLELQFQLYYDTAAYGHFGRENIALPWELKPRLHQLQTAIDAFQGQQRVTRSELERWAPEKPSDKKTTGVQAEDVNAVETEEGAEELGKLRIAQWRHQNAQLFGNKPRRNE